MAQRVALGMSGGIDSSVAAWLLKKQGYEVIGFTLKLSDHGSSGAGSAVENRAGEIARFLEVEHHILDLREDFRKHVVDYFIGEYMRGRTPNPCVACNQRIKFPFLFSRLEKLGLDYLATGHYARIEKKDDELFFARAADGKKSQEYFLAAVSRDFLPRLLFPLGDMLKEEVKALSRRMHFPFRQNESQDFCFIPAGRTCPDFLSDHAEGKDLSGNFLNSDGKVLGRHGGFFRYTIGQRQGLGLAGHSPFYVLKINNTDRSIIVGKKEEAYCSEFSVSRLYWYGQKRDRDMRYYVKIRYNHPAAPARISIQGERGVIRFEKAQFAVTPGQLAVFYRGDCVAGSGWIEGVI